MALCKSVKLSGIQSDIIIIIFCLGIQDKIFWKGFAEWVYVWVWLKVIWGLISEQDG